MKVFISWSGPLARDIAEKLRGWLRKVIQVLEPFVSTQDIEKGDVWLVELLHQLEQSSVGIICVTRENLHSDWVLFESGALIRQMGRAKLCTLLIDVSPAEIGPPLSAFQATTFKREDVFRLVQTIHSALERPLLSERELEENFATHWPDLDSHLRNALSAPTPSRSEIQDLAEELLLPVIYREAVNGDLDTVFHWLEIAKAKKIASLESQLAFVEAALARLTGKRWAGHNLRTQGSKETELGFLARVEYCHLQFAAGYSLHELPFDLSSLEKLPRSSRRTAYALVGLWHLREGRSDDAKRCLHLADPTPIFSGEVGESYRALALGILCFGLGLGEYGEKHFDLARAETTLPNRGYPFVSLLNSFDRAFVAACIGRRTHDFKEDRIRDFKGHAWVLIKYAELMRRNQSSLETLSKISAGWQNPLEVKIIADRLLQFQKKLLGSAGAPLLT
jgi:hypothetical protein